MFRRALFRLKTGGGIARSPPYSSSPSQTGHHLYMFTEEEEMLRSMVNKFANEVVKPKVATMDEAAKIDPDIVKAMFDQGLMGIEIPAEFGGANAGFFASLLAIEELAKIDPAVALLCDVQGTLVNNVFFKWATPDQQKRYLTRLAKDTVGSYCLSEPSAGSDAFSLKTTAKRNGDHYLLNGTKMWISNSAEAGIFVVFANAKTEDGYRGISCFVVEKSFPGLSVGKNENKIGIRASSTCPVHFDDVKVPLENVIGEIGRGYKYAMEILNGGRIGIAAQMVGLAQGAFDIAVAYAKERKQFGKALTEFQAMQHQIADTAMQIEAARLLTYNAARTKQSAEALGDFSSQSYVYQAAMAKLFSSQVAQLASTRAVDWMGGVGFIKGTPGTLVVEKFYRDSKIGTIYEGTSNIQLNTIAKYIIDGKSG